MTVPADLSIELQNRIRETAVKAFKALGCKGFARIDFFLTDEGEVIGFGSNEYYQLGNGNEVKQFISEYATLNFPDFVNSISATDLGTVAVSIGGKIMYCGTFLNHELTLITENESVREKTLIRQEDGTVRFVENTWKT